MPKITEEQVKEWNEVKSGGVYKFVEINETLVGSYLGCEDSSEFQNKVYRIQMEDQSIVALFGTTILNSKMLTVPVGSLVKITYTGDTPHEKKGYNAIKQFDVFWM